MKLWTNDFSLHVENDAKIRTDFILYLVFRFLPTFDDDLLDVLNEMDNQ